MNAFRRMLVQVTIGMMILGLANVVVAAPIPKGNAFGNSSGIGFDPVHGSKGQSKGSSGVGCWNHTSQGSDSYSMALDDSIESDCFAQDGQTTWMYAPGCRNMELPGNRMPSGHCSADDQIVTNLGNLVIRSSDQGLGRLDVPAQFSGNKNSLSSVVAGDQEPPHTLNVLSSSDHKGQAVMAVAFRFDRMGQDLFGTDDADRTSLALDFDHQLVMSGKLAHLVPKSENGPREFELRDLVFLLLFAFLPEKKRIQHFFRGFRRFPMF